MRTLFNFVIIILFSGCTFFKEDPFVRIGINSWPGYEYLYLAEQKGFFKKNGVKVKIVEFNSLLDSRRAFENGQVDIIGTTIVEQILIIAETDLDPVVFKVVDYSTGADVIIAKPSVKDLSSLKGKRVGAETSSLPIYELAIALKSKGLSLKDVEVRNVSFDDTVSRFEKNELDAVVTYPPNSLEIQKKIKSSKII